MADSLKARKRLEGKGSAESLRSRQTLFIICRLFENGVSISARNAVGLYRSLQVRPLTLATQGRGTVSADRSLRVRIRLGCIRMYVCMYVYVYVCKYVSMCVCMYVCM